MVHPVDSSDIPWFLTMARNLHDTVVLQDYVSGAFGSMFSMQTFWAFREGFSVIEAINKRRP